MARLEVHFLICIFKMMSYSIPPPYGREEKTCSWAVRFNQLDWACPSENRSLGRLHKHLFKDQMVSSCVEKNRPKLIPIKKPYIPQALALPASVWLQGNRTPAGWKGKRGSWPSRHDLSVDQRGWDNIILNSLPAISNRTCWDIIIKFLSGRKSPDAKICSLEIHLMRI